MLEKSCSRSVPESLSSPHDSNSDDSGYFTNPSSGERYELYIPAPAQMNGQDALNYHVTTRNFFAWMFNKPLVGTRLGKALIDLKLRMDEFRPDHEENEDDFLAYIDSMGYTDFRDCPDHALAVLHFAEEAQFAELWTDAFAHAVGLYSRLAFSDEFMDVSPTTKALITRANLEMELRLERASTSIVNFMEDDLGASYLGLSELALRHLERFRSFLLSFYVQQHGYWPPKKMQSAVGKSYTLTKPLLLAMFTDFRNLYSFLADEYSYPEMSPGSDALYGGISTVQTMNMFTRKNKLLPLPHPLPRLPATYFSEQHQSSRASFSSAARSFLLGQRRAKEARRTETIDALASATNVLDAKVVSCELVREYASFEREYIVRENERISACEARKVRWLLVHSILQTLVSVTRIPEEIRDTEGVEYFLCCQTAGTPPWKFAKTSVSRALISDPTSEATDPLVIRSVTDSPVSIQGSAYVAPPDLARVALKRNSTALNRPASPSTLEITTVDPACLVSSLRSQNFDGQRAAPLSHSKTPPPPRQSLLPRNAKRFSSSTKATSNPLPPIRSPSLARTLATRTNPVRCPQPRKPLNESIISGYESSPSSSSSDVETSSLSGSAPTLVSGSDSGPGTPTSPFSVRFTDTSPPSPSVYSISPTSEVEDDMLGASSKNTNIHLGNSTVIESKKRQSMHKRNQSSELARRFKENIKWREGPGWDDEVLAILRGE